MFNFTPLLGAQSSSPASQSILEFDGGIKILVDVGWDEGFDAEQLRELERQIPTLSIVLLTHATTAHLGAYAHCCKHFPLFTRIPVYATTPVISLGRTLLQDLYASTPLASTFIPQDALTESGYPYARLHEKGGTNILLQAPTSDEIATYFSLINPLKYSQPHQPLPSPFSPPLNGLTITAYSAGHTLGGTIWHVQHGMESVVYAVDWNQARELHLSGAAWLGGSAGARSEVIEGLRRPTAMICSSRGADATAGAVNKRDEMLLQMIRDTVKQGGSVLIPSDSSARILEIAYLLEETLAKTQGGDVLKGAKYFLASRTCGTTMRYVKSMLEWMEEGIVRDFETASGAQESRGHRRNKSEQNAANGKPDGKSDDHARTPFEFRNVKLVERKRQVARAMSDTSPKVIVASDTSLGWGFSKEFIENLAQDPRNLVILTERISQPENGRPSIGRHLWELWQQNQADAGVQPASIIDGAGQIFAVDKTQIVPLDAHELPAYQQYLARRKQLQTVQGEGGSALETSADVIEEQSEASSSSSEDSDEEHQGRALNVSATMLGNKHKGVALSDAELGINILMKRKNAHDYRSSTGRGRDRITPFVPKRKRGDEFGDLIRPEGYVRAEEVYGGDQADGTMRQDNTVGQKRKWGDTQKGQKGNDLVDGVNKRRKGRKAGAVTTSSLDDQLTNGVNDEEESESEPEDSEPKVEGPTKVNVVEESLQLQCRVSFIDFSGLHDKRSLHMLIPLIRPRKLILVEGEEVETLELAEECRQLLGGIDGDSAEGAAVVFAPRIGEIIDASVDTNAWVTKLAQSLKRQLHWQKVKNLEVVAITAILEAASIDQETADEGIATKKLKLQQKDGEEPVGNEGPEANLPPALDVIPASMASAIRAVTQPLHVGDMRLNDLRKGLQRAGLIAEFRGEGTLLVNGEVAVRKSGTGQIEVECGTLRMADPRYSTFSAVKKEIYDGLAIVAGG